MTNEEAKALRAHAQKCVDDKPEPYFWDNANKHMQAIVATPDGWTAVLALLDERERMREALDLIKSDAWTHPADYETDRRMRLERIGHHVRFGLGASA